MRQHYDRGRWLDFDFDLSPYAGKTVVVRLQVEPGPKNNASFDYSFFGDAQDHGRPGRQDRARAGAGADRHAGLPGHRPGRVARDPEQRAAARASCPSISCRATNRLEQAGDVWRFTYEGDDCRVVYT